MFRGIINSSSLYICLRMKQISRQRWIAAIIVNVLLIAIICIRTQDATITGKENMWQTFDHIAHQTATS